MNLQYNFDVIGYTDDLSIPYSEGIKKCKTLEDLRTHVNNWRPAVIDAWEVVAKMSEADFIEFEAGMRKEGDGKYSGDQWASLYATVVIPELIFRVALMAEQFNVPEGCAWIRLVDDKLIKKKADGLGGHFYWAGE